MLAVSLFPSPSRRQRFRPDLPGCVAAGETREATLQLIREAIAFHIEGMRRHGQTVPEPTSSCEYVDVVVTS